MSKILLPCPGDPNRVLDPKTGRCYMLNNVVIKKLLQEGYVINMEKYLDPKEITPIEESGRKGKFTKITDAINIINYLIIKARVDPIVENKVCFFDAAFYFRRGLKSNSGNEQIKYLKDPSELIAEDANYEISNMTNKAVLFSSPRSKFTSAKQPLLLIHPLLPKFLRNCEKRFLILPLSLVISSVNEEITSNSLGHANILIFDTKNKTIERFDPHGNEAFYNQSIIDNYLTIKFKDLLSNYKYIEFSVTCPYLGPQVTVERNTSKARGYCVIWSLMFVIFRLLNPDVPSLNIIKVMSEGSPNEVANRILRFAKHVSDTLKNN